MSQPRKPHVVLFHVDQMHADCFSAVGHPYVKTPNIDAIAREGVLFTRAVCNNPCCLPSRASLMTGEYPSSTGMFAFNGVLPSDSHYLYDVFREAGYATGATGKYHLKCIPLHRWTFDYSAPTLPEDQDYAKPHGNHYDRYSRDHNLRLPTDQIHGHYPDLGDPDPAKSNEGRFSSKMNPADPWSVRMHCESDVPTEHSLERYTADRCIEFLNQAVAGQKPAFAYCSFDRPHWPGTLSKEWFEKIDPDALELEEMPTAEQLADMVPARFISYMKATSRYTVGDRAFRQILACYFKLIEWIDEEIGRVLETLEELGIREDTVLVFTSDHGDAAGYCGSYDKAAKASNPANVRVPLVMAPARSQQGAGTGRVIDAPAELVDIAPTLCGLCGLEKPDTWQGRDLSDLILKGGDYDADAAVFCEEHYRIAVIQHGHMLVAYMDNQREWALYDLEHDPHAYQNLISAPDRQALRMELMQTLARHYADIQLGAPTEKDIEYVEARLKGDPALLPILVGGSTDGLVTDAAFIALSSTDPHQVLFIPRYDSEPMLFKGSNGYVNASLALPFDPALAEPLMQRVISMLMHRAAFNGSIEVPCTQQTPPSQEEIEKVLTNVP